jgi:hydrogenase maturation protein HypF
MAGFPMCEHCEHEYELPADRRFHAQPNACPVCGPHLELHIPGGATFTDDPLLKARELLRRGRIVALKGLGGYHLACDAFSAEAIARLRQRKHRPHKPFAVMFRDLATLRQFCEVSEAEEAELLNTASPIVIVRCRRPVPVAPDTATVGAFLPYTPLHHLLLKDFTALVMTSGNRSDEPIATEITELPAGVADAVLSHNRPIVHKCDDSVLRVIQGQRQFFRRARGFVPNAIRIAQDSPALLAVGGELKSTFCLAHAGHAFLSQHIGDLKEFKTYDYFAKEITGWQQLLRLTPTAVAHDLHPAYLSTRYAKETGWPAIAVQHHHAHIASVMAEHDLREPVIGLALDGTGYGTDGTIWGGEVLVADRADFERVAHFKTYAMPGGDKAVVEPWRMAGSVLLAEHLSEPTGKLATIQQMLTTGFNAPLTSSAGRLFDAVASILGLCDVATYEAQPAIRLEAIAAVSETGLYPFDLRTQQRPWVLDFGATIRAILEEKRAGISTGTIAGKFHNTVAAALVRVCRHLRAQRTLGRVALSGGVFQNALLLQRVQAGLRANRFEVFTNIHVPANDGGLALGQAAVAAERLGSTCV